MSQKTWDNYIRLMGTNSKMMAIAEALGEEDKKLIMKKQFLSRERESFLIQSKGVDPDTLQEFIGSYQIWVLAMKKIDLDRPEGKEVPPPDYLF